MKVVFRFLNPPKKTSAGSLKIRISRWLFAKAHPDRTHTIFSTFCCYHWFQWLSWKETDHSWGRQIPSEEASVWTFQFLPKLFSPLSSGHEIVSLHFRRQSQAVCRSASKCGAVKQLLVKGTEFQSTSAIWSVRVCRKLDWWKRIFAVFNWKSKKSSEWNKV